MRKPVDLAYGVDERPPLLVSAVVAVQHVGATIGIAALGLMHRPDGSAAPSEAAITLIAIVVMIVLNIWTKGRLRLFSILIGIVVGYAAALATGVLQASFSSPSGSKETGFAAARHQRDRCAAAWVRARRPCADSSGLSVQGTDRGGSSEIGSETWATLASGATGRSARP